MKLSLLTVVSATVVGILQVCGHSLAGILAVVIYLSACAAASAASSPKTRSVEDRLNAIVPRVPVPKNDPGQNANGATTGGNTSFGMNGGTQVTYSAGSGNNGGSNSQTSGQIGGASAHVHDMTHYHTSSSDLQTVFNALRDSYSTTVSQLNGLSGDHNQLVSDHSTLRSTVKATGVLK